MTRAAALVSLLLALLCMPHGATRVHAFGYWVAPQNHRSVNGSCVAANLDADDFCAAVVTYPVSSSLLRTRGAEGLLAPVEAARADHESILQRNDLGAVLSARAAAEYSALLAHHDEAAVVAANLPGGVRHAARARAISRGASEAEAESAAAATPIPRQEQCESLLRRYSCQNQYARCEDRAQYRDALGRPTELHTCYALCHAVRSTCHLSHRLDCRAHHRRLDPLWEQPSEHALRFDPLHSGDPYAAFWRVDCTDSPPEPWKHLGLFLLHGGPARYLAYAAAAVIIYAMVSVITGLGGDSPVVAGMRLRRERRAQSAREESLLQRARNKHGKLLQLRTQLLSPRTQVQAQGPAGERALRIAQVDEAIARLEREVGVMMRAVQERRAKEDEEDVAAGRAPASARSSSSSSASSSSFDPRAQSSCPRHPGFGARRLD